MACRTLLRTAAGDFSRIWVAFEASETDDANQLKPTLEGTLQVCDNTNCSLN